MEPDERETEKAMTDLKSKTVEELRECNRRSHSYDGFRTVENCVSQFAFDEVASRLEEAQQITKQLEQERRPSKEDLIEKYSEAHDAEVAAKALEEESTRHSDDVAADLRIRAAEYRAKAGRKE